MNCEECRDHLPEYLYEELAEEIAAKVRAHLQTCPTCPADFAVLCQTRSVLARWQDQEPRLGLTFVSARQPLLSHLWEITRGWRRVGLAAGFALVAVFVLLAVSNTTVSYKDGHFTFSASLWQRPGPSITPEMLESFSRATLAAAEQMVRLSEQRQRLEFARTLNDFAQQIEYRRQQDLGLVGRGLEELHLNTLTRLERTDRMLEQIAHLASSEQGRWP